MSINDLDGDRKMFSVAVINESSVTSDDEVRKMVPSLQIQVSRDFSIHWNRGAHLSFVAKGQKANPMAWQLVILDDSDQADALGYHELTPTGQPIGKVFAKSDIEDGLSLSVTTSHELLEMVADPYVNYIHQLANGDVTIVEVCDPVEDDSLGYMINDVLVSDFVLPPYFGYTGTQFDFMNHLKAPFPQLAPGGYTSLFSNGSWSQITAETAPGVKSARSIRSYRTSIIHGKQPLRRS